MKFDKNSAKGNAGLSMAIAYFGSNGWNVSIPLNDTQEYDLVVEKDGKFSSVQCKATSHKNGSGNYEVSLKSCGGTKGKVYKTVIETSIDLLFVLTEEKTMYLFPSEVITQKSTLSLNNEKSKFSNNGCIDTSLCIVNI